MMEETNRSFRLWNTFREGTSRELDEVAVYVCIDAWKADWAKAKSLADEPFKSQFERIRQVVVSALAQAKHQGVWFNYTVARPPQFWDDHPQVGYRYTWTYEELGVISSTVAFWDNSSDRSPATLVVVTDTDPDILDLGISKSPACITITFPDNQAAKKEKTRSTRQGTQVAWLEHPPLVNFEYRPYFEWKSVLEQQDKDLDFDDISLTTLEEEEVAVPSIKEEDRAPLAKKRRRQEETDNYLSFVERTMAAYKKL